MKIIGERIVHKGQFLSFKEISFENNGRQGIWECVERNEPGDIVCIFALTRENEVIVEKSFRVPLGAYTMELPAGLMDKTDRNPADAVRRELLEETGYDFPGEPQLILQGPFNSGRTNDRLLYFFASNAEKVAEQNLEDGEEIEVIKVPLRAFVDFALNPPKDCFADVKLVSLLPVLYKKKLIKSF
ncbi:MAG: NUDIX hydrolase [bacterium]|nr:NUDIX hydrolase [bacterium]